VSDAYNKNMFLYSLMISVANSPALTRSLGASGLDLQAPGLRYSAVISGLWSKLQLCEKPLSDRSDVISEVPNVPKSKFSGAPPRISLGELRPLPRPLARGVPKNHIPALGPSDFASTGLRV